MINKEEFLVLYQKYLDGRCSPAEKELLAAYSDDMHLPDDAWAEDTDPMEVRARIWQKLSESRQEAIVMTPKHISYRWLWAAASLLIVGVLAGLLFMPVKKNPLADILAKKTETAILPGSNKAYLTLANGTKIVLDDAKNGQLTAGTGVKVSKAANGVVVYKFDRRPDQQDGTAMPQINTITTPRGGQYQVVLEDGTKVQLNAASSIKFPEFFNGANREIELNGEAYFEVAKDKAHPFIVKANGTQVQVLGTHFNINAYSDNDDITTTLLEGSVKMSKGTAAVMLLPGQQGTVNQNGSSIKVQKADVEANMAWINGFFIFHDQSIINIMKQVSRWYDVDVEYQDAQVQENEFGGTISKYKDIKELLDNIKLTGSIHYKIEGRRVIIMK
ncbi:FecR domain-containing protein [Mucilaginibacter sp. SMC90]|uniref:FecR family protein n=1 Tax=Mucilaginibacter sp. SMC90 TaxID=2929803 RepID=UPI001FB2594C|nr:FecR family protein [Mucilaginibacter sp. SMC90]UOE47211.1 FecR domain-containing protein [Mucilaginibacter sp. SMC90]